MIREAEELEVIVKCQLFHTHLIPNHANISIDCDRFLRKRLQVITIMAELKEDTTAMEEVLYTRTTEEAVILLGVGIYYS